VGGGALRLRVPGEGPATAGLDDWRTFTLASDPRTPKIVRQALSHWMFEHIHPAADGNGHIDRLLVPLMLRQKGATHAACGFFGEAVHEEKALYVEALRAARVTGDMGPWARLMLSFLDRTAAANLSRLDRLAAIDAEWRRLAAGFRVDSMVHALVPFALTRPVFTVRDALDALGGTFASVNTAATRLVEAGVLTISNGSRRDRLFQAGAVLEIFDRFRGGREQDLKQVPIAC
jgi:Fic family protein